MRAQVVSWFPSYEAAKALVEMRRSSEPFLHLAHPRPVAWNTLIKPISAQLGVPLVSYAEWLGALEKSASAVAGCPDEVDRVAANPALQFLWFFKGQIVAEREGMDREPMGIVKLSTEKATRVSETLASLPPLDEACAVSWVTSWRAAGFL